MDQASRFSLSASALYGQLGTAQSPLLLDVRPTPSFDSDRVMIVGAVRRAPETLARWAPALPIDRSIVVYCGEGLEISETVVAALRQEGRNASLLEGGLGAWIAAGLPQRFRRPASAIWVTREHPKIDRIACPWLIRRFINPEAEFLYVPSADVHDTATRTRAIAYDVADAEFGHVGDQCSFDAFLRIYGIRDPILDRLATIVRGADTGRPELTPQSPGLLAISQGLSANFSDDHTMLDQGMVLYDALFAWCRSQLATAARASAKVG
jgi:rhodanese-related sulfurtransferase